MTQSVDELRVSAAKIQSLFREVNERIEALRPSSTFIEFACECALVDCIEFVEITQQEYESIRQHPNRFFVRPGHVIAAVEDVVRAEPRYEIVSKLGVGGEMAAQLDPRRAKQRANGAT